MDVTDDLGLRGPLLAVSGEAPVVIFTRLHPPVEEFTLDVACELILNFLGLSVGFQLLDIVLRDHLEHHREVLVILFDGRVELPRQVSPEPAHLFIGLLVLV